MTIKNPTILIYNGAVRLIRPGVELSENKEPQPNEPYDEYYERNDRWLHSLTDDKYSVEVEERYIDRVNWAMYDDMNRSQGANGLYPIDVEMEIQYQIKDQDESDWENVYDDELEDTTEFQYRQIAVIVEKPGKEETQEGLWAMVIEKVCGDKGRHKPQTDTLNDLSDVFTITRK